VRTLQSGQRERRVEQVVRAQRDEAIGLLAPSPAQHQLDRRAQVVIADQREDTAKPRERLDVRFQKRLLRAAPKRHAERRAREARAQIEQLHRDLAAAQQHVRLTPVDLGLHPGLVDLRHEHPTGLTELASPRGDVLAHRALGHLGAMLVDQPPPDPPRRVTLLARRRPIGLKPLVDQRPKRTQRRRRPTLRPLARRRQRRLQRLTHRPSMHPMALGERPDRQALAVMIPADLLEQLHPGTHPLCRPPVRALTRARSADDRTEGGAKSSRHSGANSGRRSQLTCRTRQDGGIRCKSA
jgi:hypothetical protein